MPLRSRRPALVIPLGSQCAVPGHAGLERRPGEAYAALAEALGCLRYDKHPSLPELDAWRGQMAPAVYERLSGLAATRGAGG